MASGPEGGRRSFLKGSLFGLVLLGSAAPLLRAIASDGPGTDWLQDDDRAMIRAIARQLLAGSLPTETAEAEAAINDLLPLVEDAVRHQPAAVRQELREFFDLLQLAPARLALCGFWSGWESATAEDVDRFLSWWRGSRLELLRSAYLGLHELIVPAYFMLPQSWTRIGYADRSDIIRGVDPLAAK